MWLISLFIIENNFNISKFYETSNTDLRAFFFSSSLRAFFLGDLLTKLALCLDHVPIFVRVSPRKKALSEDEKSEARRSVLLVSQNLLILKLISIINKEMSHMFMPFYIYPTVKMKEKLPRKVPVNARQIMIMIMQIMITTLLSK